MRAVISLCKTSWRGTNISTGEQGRLVFATLGHGLLVVTVRGEVLSTAFFGFRVVFCLVVYCLGDDFICLGLQLIPWYRSMAGKVCGTWSLWTRSSLFDTEGRSTASPGLFEVARWKRRTRWLSVLIFMVGTRGLVGDRLVCKRAVLEIVDEGQWLAFVLSSHGQRVVSFTIVLKVRPRSIQSHFVGWRKKSC